MPSLPLVRTWRACKRESLKSDAAAWYPRANQWAHETARTLGVPPTLIVDLIAVLSPGVQWEVNKRDAIDVVRWGKKHRPATWRVGREKAFALLDGYSFDDLVSEQSSPKVWNFRNNIADPRRTEYVTVDRWIARYHGYGERFTYNQYQDIAGQYIHAARNLGLVPNVLQAYIWLRTRNEYRFGPQMEVPF